MLLGNHSCSWILLGFFVSCLFACDGLAQDASERRNDNAQVYEFFDKLESATKEESVDRLLAAFDFDALLAAVIDESGVEIQAPLRNQMRVQIEAMMRRQFELLDDEWLRHKVVDIRWTEDREIAEVFVRHWSSDLTTTRTVFFLKRTDQGLRIYDLVDQSIGFGTVSLTAALLRDGMKSSFPAQVGRGLKILFKAMIAAVQQDSYETQDWLDNVVGSSLPPMVESLRWNLRAAIFLESDPVEALECIDKVVAFNDRVVMAPYLRASAHLNLGNYELAARYANEYLNQFGGDADAFYVLGLALSELDRTDESIAAYRNGLKDTPEALALVEELALVLPDDRKQEFVPAFRNLPDPMEYFEYLADAFEAQEDGAALSTLVDAALQITQEVPNLAYYRCVLMIQEERYDQAFNRIMEILDEEDDSDYRFYYESLLCSIAVKVNRIDDAYEVSEDKYEALTSLEYAISTAKDSVEEDEEKEAARREKLIDQLYERYAGEFPEDPETWGTLADRAVEKDDDLRAIEHYTKAVKYSGDGDEDNAEGYVRECVRCYVRAGKASEAYEKIDDKQTVYDCLRYQLDNESEEFLKIQVAYRKQFPNDWSVVYEKLQELFEQGRFQVLLDTADEQIANASSQDESSDESDDWIIGRVRFLRILCLAKLGRTDEALVAARGEDPDARDLLRTLIYGIKGDRKRFAEAYQWCAKSDEYFGPDNVKMYIDVPEDWLPESSQRGFEAYRELRRVVFLLKEPIALSAYSVRLHSEAVGMQLFELEKVQLSTSEEDYICQLNRSSVIVGVNRCSYFLEASASPYYGNLKESLDNKETFLDDIDDETEKRSEANKINVLRTAIETHRAWIAIDIYAWPQDLDSQSPVAISSDDQKRLALLAQQIVGDRAVMAYHCDGGWMEPCDAGFFKRLVGDTPMAAFHLAN